MLTCGKRFMKVLSWISVKFWIGSWMPWKLRLCKTKLSIQGRVIKWTVLVPTLSCLLPINDPCQSLVKWLRHGKFGSRTQGSFQVFNIKYYNMPTQAPPQPQRLSIENCSSLENEVAMHPEESEGVVRHSYHGLGKPSEGVLVGAFFSMSSTTVVLEFFYGKK